MQLWLVKPTAKSNAKFITWARNREHAKIKAQSWFGSGHPWDSSDNYIVEPVTMPGDRVKLDIVLSV